MFVIVFVLLMWVEKIFIISVGKIEVVVRLKVRVMVCVVKSGGFRFNKIVIIIVVVIDRCVVISLDCLDIFGVS